MKLAKDHPRKFIGIEPGFALSFNEQGLQALHPNHGPAAVKETRQESLVCPAYSNKEKQQGSVVQQYLLKRQTTCSLYYYWVICSFKS